MLLPLIKQWKPYWAPDKVFLVEKSPHSLLKIPLLRRVFAGAISLKFIVLLKVCIRVGCESQVAPIFTSLHKLCRIFHHQHPVTLNVATPKGFGWQFVEKAPSVVASGAKEARKRLSFGQTCDGVQFFLDMMRQDNSTLYSHRFPPLSNRFLYATSSTI